MINLIEIEESIKKLNRLFAITIIPALGVTIPNLAGIISNDLYNWWQLIFSYGYFIFISFLIWKGNIIFFRHFRRKYEQEKGGYFSILTCYFVVNIIYSLVITILFLLAWQVLSKETIAGTGPLYITGMVVLTSVILINNVYELILSRKEMEETLMQFKRMEMAKMQAELEALRAQIDPHFIFNSLNTLSYLITQKPETAKLYTQTLAKVYRYILLNKDKDLVFLKDELEFINNYFFLIRIRFEDAVSMNINIPDVHAENHLIAPISLQMLIENAVKHNYFSKNTPLVIGITMQSLFVFVRNKIKRKDFQSYSSGIGLNNLKERYRLIMKKNVVINRDNEEFLVKVPILKA